MSRRSRLILLSIVLVGLVPLALFVNRDRTLSDAALRRKAERENRALLETQVPQVVLPNIAPAPTTGHKKDYRFDTDWFTLHVPVWEQALAEYKDKPDVRYLEIGLHHGRSFFWVLENILTHPSTHLTGLDLFYDEPGATVSNKDVFLANLKLSGAEDRVDVLVGYSQIELRKLPIESYDIVYIDGSHAASDVLEDAVLSHRLLKPGGLLIFDDYLWKLDGAAHERPKPAIDAFYALFSQQYDVVHNGYQLMLRKKRAAAGS